MPDLADIRKRLAAVDQAHLLSFYDRLDPAAQSRLLAQVGELDLGSLPALVETYVLNKPVFTLPARLEPARYYPSDPTSPVRKWDKSFARGAGERLLRDGRVAAFTVAGGQGSRLGYEGPKGCYPAGAVTGKPLFQFFAEGLRKAESKWGRPIPWYIMTSPLNHEPSIAYFKEHRYFGLRPESVMFFPQGVMPSFDIGTGKVLLAAEDDIATNPDGHGGSLKALHASGALDDMRRRGVQHISYFQVDNPIVKVVDPVFLGLHSAAPDSSGEMSSKMIPKAYPEEKLGLFCLANGRTEVIEYSDLPMELQKERRPDGSLRFLCGSIAVHILSVEFVNRLNTDAKFSLPYHRAEKKVPCIDPANGAPIDPQAPNGVKLERFVFDALPLCRASIVYETDRIEEFAPIKNATGVDSPESSARIQTQRAARWIAPRGVAVAAKPDGVPDCTIELSPLTAIEPEDLAERPLPARVDPGARLVI